MNTYSQIFFIQPLMLIRQGHADQFDTLPPIWITYDALQANSYKGAVCEHFPKHQPDGLVDKMKERAKLTHDDKVEFVHTDGLTCYISVQDPLYVAGTYPPRPSSDLREKMFTRMQGLPDTKKTSPREVPVAWPANLSTLQQFHQSLWKGFNYLNHCSELSKYLPGLLRRQRNLPSLSNLNYSFWNPPRQQSIKKPVVNPPMIRSKL
jgi:hypothetical protein